MDISGIFGKKKKTKINCSQWLASWHVVHHLSIQTQFQQLKCIAGKPRAPRLFL